jgi:hypothetical protein
LSLLKGLLHTSIEFQTSGVFVKVPVLRSPVSPLNLGPHHP